MRVLPVLMLMVLCLTIACSPAPIVDSASPSGTPIADMTELPDAFVDRLQTFLSQETGVPTAEIAIQQAEPTNWSDSCLGTPQPDEFCALAITPGYRLTLTTPQGNYALHSDQQGRSFRLAQRLEE